MDVRHKLDAIRREAADELVQNLDAELLMDVPAMDLDVTALAAAVSQEGFTTFHMTSGAEIPVLTVDHVSILRHARRVFVDTDDGKTYHIIVPDQISHVTAASRAA